MRTRTAVKAISLVRKAGAGSQGLSHELDVIGAEEDEKMGRKSCLWSIDWKVPWV